MINPRLVIGVLLGTIGVVVGAGVLMARLEKQTGVLIDQETVVGEARLATGSATAKVTIVEWSDFQCPACRQAVPLVKDILEKYPEQVRLVYRQFPLTQIHQQAMAAAELAEAAYVQGKFWEMHDVLFKRQDEWTENGDKLVDYRQELGISSGETYKDKIDQDVSEGRRLGVNATPTFFVNGRKAMAGQLEVMVEEELRK